MYQGYCCDVLSITSLACEAAKTLNDEELRLFIADVSLFRDVLNDIAVRRNVCQKEAAAAKARCEQYKASNTPNSKATSTTSNLKN